MLTFGYPKLIGDPKPKGFEEEDEGGEYSSLSVSSKLLGYFLKDPIKTFDTIFNLYPSIKRIIGNNSHFYSNDSLLPRGQFSEVDFNWRVTKNPNYPNYLDDSYNSYSELIFYDQKIELLGAKKTSYDMGLAYRTDNKLNDMKWRMKKFFHRRGEFLSNLTGFYLLKILKNEAKINDKAVPFYNISYRFFSKKYNSFAERWNSGAEINNPYKRTVHKIYLNEYANTKLLPIAEEKFSEMDDSFKVDIDFALNSKYVNEDYFGYTSEMGFCGHIRSQSFEFSISDVKLKKEFFRNNPRLSEIPIYGSKDYDFQNIVVLSINGIPKLSLHGWYDVGMECEDITNDGTPELFVYIKTRANASVTEYIFLDRRVKRTRFNGKDFR